MAGALEQSSWPSAEVFSSLEANDRISVESNSEGLCVGKLRQNTSILSSFIEYSWQPLGSLQADAFPLKRHFALPVQES